MLGDDDDTKYDLDDLLEELNEYDDSDFEDMLKLVQYFGRYDNCSEVIGERRV